MWNILLLLLALRSDALIATIVPCLTEHENQMMAAGTFVYSSLSSQQEAMLFVDYEVAHSRKVKLDCYATYSTRNK